MSILQIKWSRPALADLIEAQAYIAQENPQAAEVIAQRIWDATQTLADNPLIGRNGHLAGRQQYVKVRDMKKSMASRKDRNLMDEYEFSGGVRGKYAKRYKEGTNIVRLDEDVAEKFPNSEKVNDALRSLIKQPPQPQS